MLLRRVSWTREMIHPDELLGPDKGSAPDVTIVVITCVPFLCRQSIKHRINSPKSAQYFPTLDYRAQISNEFSVGQPCPLCGECQWYLDGNDPEEAGSCQAASPKPLIADVNATDRSSMRRGIHPMCHLVRIVLTNGASYTVPLPWQRPYPTLEITTKFLEEDYISHENFTGVPSKGKRKVGRRARFESKFKVDKD